MLKIENATLKRDKKTIFENYSFEIKKGDIVAILGPNGRGKTTLLKAILNLLPLDKGEIKNDAQIAYVPQSSQLIFDFTVLDVILMGRAKHLKLFSNPSKKDYNLAYEVLELLEIKEFANRNFSELSGGEKQLVLIARAIASQCDFLILDEPASALDFSNQKKVLNQLKLLNSEKKITILYTTHYPQHAFYLSNKVLLMFKDNYLFDTTEKLMTNETLSRLYGIDIKKVCFEEKGENIQSVIPIF
jgi:iron complex transport system ATP-binding protein